MDRLLRVAIIAAAVVLLALLVRRATQSTHAAPAAETPAPDVFTYRGEVELGAPVVTPPLSPRLGIARADIDAACESDTAAARSMVDLAPRMTPELLADVGALPDDCFEPPDPPGLCAWAADEITRAGSMTSAAWALLPSCPVGVAAPFFDRADAPAESVLAFVDRRELFDPWRRPPAHLPTQYARAVIERASVDPASASAPPSMISYEDAAATEALAQAYVEAPDAARRHAVVSRMAILADAHAQDVVRMACGVEPTLPACTASTLLAPTGILMDAASYVERRPAERMRVLAELEACARGAAQGLPGPPATCLADIASIDWSRARAIALELAPHRDPALAGLVAQLSRQPTRESVVLVLQTRHLLGPPRVPSANAITVPAIMASYGRGWIFGPHAARGLGHAVLAQHLARLGGLDDVVIEEAPSRDAPSGIRLRASTHGETFAAPAVDDGDFFDLDAMVGLLNVVARVRGANVRYLVVQDPLAYEAIVLGPPAELASALAEGLLETPREDAQIEPDLPF